jgi:putative sterol carrier protein
MSVSEQFFADLAERGHDPRLHQAQGTVQFELAHNDRTDRCLVEIAHGDVTVSSGATSDGDETPACVVRCPGPLFDDIVTGRANALAAMLRGELTAEGDLQLLYQFQRVFPGPPDAVHPREQLTAKRNGS